ncbi:MAG TPA: mechanosensitive ion channel domain-containing protein [Erythrobacter sp.]|nr:mechanosensitive ion channel domain-containing protein [Erythrobacter sp.]
MSVAEAMVLQDLSALLPGEQGSIDIVWTLAAAVVLALAALALHGALVFVARRLSRRTSTTADEMLIEYLRKPLRWFMVAAALLTIDAFAVPSEVAAQRIAALTRMAMPLLWGWLVIAAIRFLRSLVYASSDIAADDNLAARRRRTRADILTRIAIIIVILISAGLMLLKIPEVREIGVALVASAGLAGLAVGVAAQPLLKNLVGGFQLAFTEPVRIDDVIVFRGEWGRIEHITLTYIVLRIWDDRRLVIPVSKLVEEPIENWTRHSSQLLGTVFIHVDHGADVDALRAIAVEAVRGHRLWDGRVALLQVTEMTPETIQLRILMSGRNGGELFDLRCDVRETMVRALAEQLPGSIARNRVLLEENG